MTKSHCIEPSMARLVSEHFGLKPEDGYKGVFTRSAAPNAMPNGTRVHKRESVVGDTKADGELATVLGSITGPDGQIFYFVEWDTQPKVAVGILHTRIGAAQ